MIPVSCSSSNTGIVGVSGAGCEIKGEAVAVDPDYLDISFGPGVRLKRITVQMTKEPVSTRIEKRFE